MLGICLLIAELANDLAAIIIQQLGWRRNAGRWDMNEPESSLLLWPDLGAWFKLEIRNTLSKSTSLHAHNGDVYVNYY